MDELKDQIYNLARGININIVGVREATLEDGKKLAEMFLELNEALENGSGHIPWDWSPNIQMKSMKESFENGMKELRREFETSYKDLERCFKA